MDGFRSRLHFLIDQLSDEELDITWNTLAQLYCDLYMLRAIQSAKRTLKPGDSFTRDEALRFLLTH